MNSASGTSFTAGLLAICVSLAWAQGIPMPPFERMIDRVDPVLLRQIDQATQQIQRNPKDVTALVTRGAVCLNAANQSRYGFFWIYKAAKDLEAAINLDPNNFYARHNYAQAAFQMGDMGRDQPNMRLAVYQFTKAIALNPKSARSYMGRGFAYQMLNQEAKMQADYATALRLEPSLRADLVKESEGIASKRAQLAGVPAMLDRMARYYVEPAARTQNQCTQYRGYWTTGECRISRAFDPAP
jgi:tetratricopeptide (TPR) repeat protein